MPHLQDVGEGNMSRYINAELIEYDHVYMGRDDSGAPCYEDAVGRNTIEAVPTADVRENVHGHWIVTGRTNIYGGIEVTCSECGDTLMVQYLELEHFCRNCGADMRGEK